MRQAGICGGSIQRIQRIQKNVIEKIEKIETKGWHFGKFLKGGLIAPAFSAAPKLDPPHSPVLVTICVMLNRVPRKSPASIGVPQDLVVTNYKLTR